MSSTSQVSTNSDQPRCSSRYEDQARMIASVHLGDANAYHSIYDDRKAGGPLLISVAAVDDTIEQ